MGNLRDHAERELQILGYDLNDKEEGPNKWMVESVLELIDVFSKQGHSGFSAPYCIGLFTKLAGFKPASPITGEEHEWYEVGPNVWQNNRCSTLFKEADGRAYDIDGKVFREPNGACYTSRESRVYVEFPYVPTTEYIDVPFSHDQDVCPSDCDCKKLTEDESDKMERQCAEWIGARLLQD